MMTHRNARIPTRPKSFAVVLGLLALVAAGALVGSGSGCSSSAGPRDQNWGSDIGAFDGAVGASQGGSGGAGGESQGSGGAGGEGGQAGSDGTAGDTGASGGSTGSGGAQTGGAPASGGAGGGT